ERKLEALAREVQTERSYDIETAIRDGEACDGTGRGNDETLHEHEHRQSAAICSEGGTNGQLLAPRSHARELKVRYVGACYKQHGQHDALQNHQHALEVADGKIAQGLRATRETARLHIRFAVRDTPELDIPTNDGVQLGVEAFLRSARPQP